MKRVLVTGSGGQLGAAFVASGIAPDVVGLPRRGLDLSDAAAVRRTVLEIRPDAILNCAAYNRVDDAEGEPLAALSVNGFGVRHLALAAAEVGATLVHYGTDFVFDGETDRAYTEADPPHPPSVYGATKLAGEWWAPIAPRHYVLRVESLFGGPNRKSSIDKLVEGLLAGAAPRVFSDRVVTASYVPDVIRATRLLLAGPAPYGTWHVVNDGQATWEDVGREAARLLGVAPLLTPVRLADAKLRAPRPRFCALSNAKLARAGIPMPTWQDALARYLKEIRR